ncbi:MAG: ATPase domain-containing protein [archaeon]|nr:hypothetical protein [Candidatus Micrarchaeota archaeon]
MNPMNLNSKTILLSAHPEESNEFCLNLMKEFLSHCPVAFISTDSSIQELRKKAEGIGLDLNKFNSDKLNLVDLYSTVVNLSNSPKLISSLNSLHQLSSLIDSLQSKKERKILIFDSLSTLIHFNPPNALYHFLFYENRRIKARGNSIIYTIKEGIHDKGVMENIIHSMDCHFKVKKEADYFSLDSKPFLF